MTYSRSSTDKGNSAKKDTKFCPDHLPKQSLLLKLPRNGHASTTPTASMYTTGLYGRRIKNIAREINE